MNKAPIFKKREVGVALNNAVAHIAGSETLMDMGDTRKRKLRNYVTAALEPLIEHVNEGYLTPDELTYCLSVGALFIYRLMTLKAGKLPMFDELAVEMIEGTTMVGAMTKDDWEEKNEEEVRKYAKKK